MLPRVARMRFITAVEPCRWNSSMSCAVNAETAGRWRLY